MITSSGKNLQPRMKIGCLRQSETTRIYMDNMENAVNLACRRPAEQRIVQINKKLKKKNTKKYHHIKE